MPACDTVAWVAVALSASMPAISNARNSVHLLRSSKVVPDQSLWKYPTDFVGTAQMNRSTGNQASMTLLAEQLLANHTKQKKVAEKKENPPLPQLPKTNTSSSFAFQEPAALPSNDRMDEAVVNVTVSQALTARSDKLEAENKERKFTSEVPVDASAEFGDEMMLLHEWMINDTVKAAKGIFLSSATVVSGNCQAFLSAGRPGVVVMLVILTLLAVTSRCFGTPPDPSQVQLLCLEAHVVSPPCTKAEQANPCTVKKGYQRLTSVAGYKRQSRLLPFWLIPKAPSKTLQVL